MEAVPFIETLCYIYVFSYVTRWRNSIDHNSFQGNHVFQVLLLIKCKVHATGHEDPDGE